MTETRQGVYWIDHYVVCTNDVDRWESFHSKVLGARTVPEPPAARLRRGIFQTFARGRQGGFTCKVPLPSTKGLRVGLPRYGIYILKCDIDLHRRRLDSAGALHSDPVNVSCEGEDGTAIYWQDPDGNQFEFWAPDVMPPGAMTDCGTERIGRISHGVFESRDLGRTADFFNRYCLLEPKKSDDIASDHLVLPLLAGGRLVFRKVNELEGRTTGCGLPDAHTALVVRDEDFFPSYARLWAELPEWDYDARSGGVVENAGELPPRTVLHVSSAGRKFKEITQRGDDWFDADTNLFHFYGGKLLDDALLDYKGYPIGHYIEEWQKNHGSVDGLREVVGG